MWNTQESGLSRGGGGETYGNFTFDKIEILGLHQVFEGDSERDAQKGEGEGGNPPLFFPFSLSPSHSPFDACYAGYPDWYTGVFGLVLHFSQSLGFLWISVLKLRFWFFVKVNWFQSHLAFWSCVVAMVAMVQVKIYISYFRHSNVNFEDSIHVTYVIHSYIHLNVWVMF